MFVGPGMVVRMSLLLCGCVILTVLSLISAVFLPWPLFTAFLLIILFSLLTVSIPVHLGWNRENFGFLVFIFVVSILIGILIFSIIYFRTGLIVDGVARKVSFTEAIYFSVTTWATLGYGDYRALPQYQLVTSAEVLIGYFAMGVFMALVALWLSEALRAYDYYVRSLPAAAKKAAEDLSKKSPELGKKLGGLFPDDKKSGLTPSGN